MREGRESLGGLGDSNHGPMDINGDAHFCGSAHDDWFNAQLEQRHRRRFQREANEGGDNNFCTEADK